MSAPKPAVPIAGIIVMGACLAPPAIMLVGLSFARPDLIRPMLDHVFGYLILGIVGVLWLAQGLIVGFSWMREVRLGLRIGITAGSVALCTLPMVFLILFGPIVWAFMFGNTGA
jgi:hypothetical protein